MKYGDEAPSWAQGKTADEILEITKQLYNTMQNTPYYSPPQSQTPSQPQMNTQHQSQTPSGPPDPNLIYTDAAEYQRRLQAWQQEATSHTISQQSLPLLQSNAELAKAESMRNPIYKEVWERYGPEIEAEVISVPLQMKVYPKFWNDAAAMIKGRRAEDIFKSRTAKADTGTVSADGLANTGLTSSTQTPLEKAWNSDAPWMAQFKRLPGMTLAKLRARVASMGWSEEDYAKQYENKTAMRIHRADDELARHGVL